MHELQQLARQARPAVEHLDAILVPLSATFKDSEGRYVTPLSDARQDLVARAETARAAIDRLLEGLR